jgi:hypothetical protein
MVINRYVNLEAIADFIHLIHRFVCTPLVYRVAHLRATRLSMVSSSQSLCGWDHPCLSLESSHTFGPSSLCLAWLLSAWRDVVMSKPSHDFLTSCAWSLVRENSTAGLLLTGWQDVLITTCLELCQFAQALLKSGLARWSMSLLLDRQENRL